MTPLCVQTNDITAEDQVILWHVRHLVNLMENGLTCHEVCDKISREGTLAEKVHHIRGWFGFKGVEHSWLTLKKRPTILIDPYPYATTSGPLLITTEGLLNPWRKIYIAQPKTKNIS